MAWLLDPNAWIVYRKTPQSHGRARLQSWQPSDVILCSTFKAESLHRAEKDGNRERRLNLLPFDDTAAARYGQIRHQLEVAGKTIGPNDLMIAAIALANNHTLATDNTSEFSHVRGLTLEDWQ